MGRGLSGVVSDVSVCPQTVVVGSYLIAHGFFSVYAMCVDTLFLCFCEYHHDDPSPCFTAHVYCTRGMRM